MFLATGAGASVTRYYQQSQEAETRANASVSDPYNLINQSAALRSETENLMNQTKEEFNQRQEEFSKQLDDLAGQLETLDLSELSEKVQHSPPKLHLLRQSKNIKPKCFFLHTDVWKSSWLGELCRLSVRRPELCGRGGKQEVWRRGL